jgi:hypothetical protein
VQVIAPGGSGKTQLVKKWRDSFAESGWQGASRVFDWTFYSQGADTKAAASSDAFFEAALSWFHGHSGSTPALPLAGWQKAEELVRLLRTHRTLLILDGVEALQHPPGPLAGSIVDPALRLLIEGVADTHLGLLVVTTRYPIGELDGRSSRTCKKLALPALSPEAGEALLRLLGVNGSEHDLQAASSDYDGHPLTLLLLGTYLKNRHGGDISQRYSAIAPELTDPLVQGRERESRHAGKIIASYLDWFEHGSSTDDVSRAAAALLRLMGLFDRPVTATVIDELRREPAIGGLTDSLVPMLGQRDNWQRAIERLQDAHLIARNGTASADLVFDCHPLIRQFCEQLLLNELPQQATEAHGRLLDYFKQLPEKNRPNSADGLAPLFQAVRHGCLAGRYRESLEDIYWKRINRGDAHYAWLHLGLYGATLQVMSYCFAERWTVLLPQVDDDCKRMIWNQTGLALSGIGRQLEAAVAFDRCVMLAREDFNQLSACINLCNCVESLLTIGGLNDAIVRAEAAIVAFESHTDLLIREKRPKKENSWYHGLHARVLWVVACARMGLTQIASNALNNVVNWWRGIYSNADDLLVGHTLYLIAEVRLQDILRRGSGALSGSQRETICADIRQLLAWEGNGSKALLKRSSPPFLDLGSQALCRAGVFLTCVELLDQGVLDSEQIASVIGHSDAAQLLDDAGAAITEARKHLRQAGSRQFDLYELLMTVRYQRVSFVRSPSKEGLEECRRSFLEADAVATSMNALPFVVDAEVEATRVLIAAGMLELGQQFLSEAVAHVAKANRVFDRGMVEWGPHPIPDWIGGVRRKQDECASRGVDFVIGYHRRNDEIVRLQDHLAKTLGNK